MAGVLKGGEEPSGVSHTHLSFRPNLTVGLRHLFFLQCLEERQEALIYSLMQKTVGAATRCPSDRLHHQAPALGSHLLLLRAPKDEPWSLRPPQGHRTAQGLAQSP